MKIANRRQMKNVDEKLLETYTIEELVEKASETLIRYLVGYSCIYIACGGGNNGADGLSLALKLLKSGKKVRVCCVSKQHSQACDFYLRQCEKENIVVQTEIFLDQLTEADVLVDALFGFGCTHNPQGIYEEVIQAFNRQSKPIYAIDVPSGLDCDSGKAYENCIRATQTMTFFAMKRGFLNPNSYQYTGKVTIETLDVKMDGLVFCESYESIAFPAKQYDGYKGTYGKAFLICGSENYHGAALLSSKACVYTGCGITYLYSSQDVLAQLSGFVAECVLARNMEYMNQCQAILIGCGLENQVDQLETVLKETRVPLVIDASSLHDLAHHIDWLNNQNREIILTPHLGEFKNLVGDVEDVTTAAIDFAKTYQVIVVLKGPHTLVTNGTQSVHVMSGSPAMASAGSGDVLAGMIVSLLAQGFSGMDSACIGVYLHGKAGEVLAETDYTAIPSRMIEKIPSLMKKYVR